MIVMKEYILNLLEKNKRIDNRKLDEFRKIEIQKDFIQRAEGSARVKFGNTDVIVGVKLEINEPFPDTPDSGILRTDAEFTPIASENFFPGPPNENAIELARIVDRGIRESETIDLEKLCLEKGEKVWGVCIDIRIINHDGNLIDASALAALIALTTTKIPKIKDDEIIREEYSGKLPLKHKPITISIGKIGDKFIIDPCLQEENLLDSILTVSVREDGKICAMQKRKNSLKVEEINKIIDLAVNKSKELRKLI